MYTGTNWATRNSCKGERGGRGEQGDRGMMLRGGEGGTRVSDLKSIPVSPVAGILPGVCHHSGMHIHSSSSVNLAETLLELGIPMADTYTNGNWQTRHTTPDRSCQYFQAAVGFSPYVHILVGQSCPDPSLTWCTYSKQCICIT